MTHQSSTRGYLLIVLAACLWATIGLFTRQLHDLYGLSALTVVFLRAGVAFVIAFIALAIFRRKLLYFSPSRLGLLVLYGLVGISVFYFLYAQAIITTSVTTAVVLLYTAPAFVTIIAWRTWGEPLTARKLVAVGLAIVGCALVAKAYDPAEWQLNLVGVLIGLGAGFTYALFTVFNKAGAEKFPLGTLITYELFFGALFLLPLQSPDAFAVMIEQPTAWVFLLGLVLGPTLGSITVFNLGLRSLPASNVSIVATIEPVVASAIAFFVFSERMDVLQIVGGIMVIGGALWLSLVQ
ncbi:MAG: EamA family transporter [Chloroflexi bacterium]|nr:EamA family transporter [Chloroflexota bacterium]